MTFSPRQTFFSEATAQEKINALRRACKRHVELTRECSKGHGQDRCGIGPRLATNIILTRSAQTSLRPLLPPPTRARKQLGRKQQLNRFIGTSGYLPGRRLGDSGHVNPVHIELREPGAAPVRLRARLAGRVWARVHHQGRRPVRVCGIKAPPDASLPRHAPGIPRGGAACARRARARCK